MPNQLHLHYQNNHSSLLLNVKEKGSRNEIGVTYDTQKHAQHMKIHTYTDLILLF